MRKPSPERLICAPGHRRESVLEIIRAARRDLVLSVFRCDDFSLLDALADAVQRNVRVRALITPHAKNWDKRLQDLGAFLDSMGAEVHRYSGGRKYHAKYIVADDGPALIASLNFTRKCFDRTCDFVVVAHDPQIAAGLLSLFEMDCRTPDADLPAGLPDSLVIGPDLARARFHEILSQASQSIRIIDHRLSDPGFVSLLRERRAAGVGVQVLGLGAVTGLVSHGKLMLVDDAIAVVGSISLSPPALNLRREVAAVIRDPANVAVLQRFFETHAMPGGGAELNEWAIPDEDDDD